MVARANGVDAAAAITTGGLSRSLRRMSGAARPATSTVQAAARIAVERGTYEGEYIEGGGRLRYGQPASVSGPPASGTTATPRRLGGLPPPRWKTRQSLHGTGFRRPATRRAPAPRPRRTPARPLTADRPPGATAPRAPTR